jgi:undecaprenyl-diphosphatase
MFKSNYHHLYNAMSGVFGGILFVFLAHSVALSQEVDTVTSNNFLEVNIFQAFILGMIQGLTEFIPISSTAHLKVIPLALGWSDPGVSFTAIIQLGSIVAVLWYFREDLINLSQGIFKSIEKKDYQTQEFKIGLGIIIGTIPIVICGLALKILITDLDNAGFRSLKTIAIASIVMAILLGVAEKIGTHRRNFEQLSTKDGILMGLAEALAIIPGVSRSGSTITAGLFLNLERATAARFSFLLGIPAITLAGLVELKDIFAQTLTFSSLILG